MKSQMLIRTPDELKESLRDIAKRRGQTMNQLVLQVLWEWIRKNETN